MATSQTIFRPKTVRRGPKPGSRGHPQTNPNSLANLIPYKKGQNGHGRVYPLKERLAHALDHPLKEPPSDAPHGDQIVYATLKGAVELVPVAFRETWDRVEGKLQDTPPPSPSGSQVLNIIVVGGSDNLKDILAQVKERTKQLAIGEG